MCVCVCPQVAFASEFGVRMSYDPSSVGRLVREFPDVLKTAQGEAKGLPRAPPAVKKQARALLTL